ncbi:autotransporter domain-containing protein [Xylella fastidiosa]|uniref:autotransporter domain-containing protein n=1 Tax=Xylella fastidiosa TaxID=2371 RepID=UPI001F39A5C2|nr:autotransporter domain-containing protein [Xylella fastidiosa]UIT42327.1 autotransporter domain-containing protein [Xylella fastidiosa subsp. multiplex]
MKLKFQKRKVLTVFIVFSIFLGGDVYANGSVPSVSNKYDFGTLTNDGSQYSYVSALSKDGRVAGGFVTPDGNDYIATIWSWNNLKDTINLGASFARSKVKALSADGSIAGGYQYIRIHESTSSANLEKKASNRKFLANDGVSAIFIPVIWSGDSWENEVKLELGILESGVVNALSGDGKTIGGYGFSTHLVPIIWSGSHWKDIKQLDVPKEYYDAEVRALSTDGKVAGGYISSKNITRGILEGKSGNDTKNFTHAFIWSGDGFGIKTDLGTLNNNESEGAEVRALSTDGKVAGGYFSMENGSVSYGVIWSGDQWTTKTQLGTLKSDNSGNSLVYALSADGKIATGFAESDSSIGRATIWLGDHWQTKIDLGTLKSDNSGYSIATALSADGTVAAGYSEVDSGKDHATVWKIIYPTQSQSESQPQSQSTVVKVDTVNTIGALSVLAAETFSVMDLQRQGLILLQQGCEIDDSQVCWSVRTGLVSTGSNRDSVVGFRFGYAMFETLSAGFSLDRSLSRSLQDSYFKNNHNLGAGFYAQWNAPFRGGEWYVRPAVAFNQYSVVVQRPLLTNTEAGSGRSRMKGRDASLEAGQRFNADHSVLLGWHLGVRHSSVLRTAYSEQNAAFPFSYSAINNRRTSAYVGADVAVPLTARLKWMAGLEIDRRLYGDDPVYGGHADYIGGFAHQMVMKRVIGTISSGVEYRLSPTMFLGATFDVSRRALGDRTWSGTLSLGGRF